MRSIHLCMRLLRRLNMSSSPDLNNPIHFSKNVTSLIVQKNKYWGNLDEEQLYMRFIFFFLNSSKIRGRIGRIEKKKLLLGILRTLLGTFSNTLLEWRKCSNNLQLQWSLENLLICTRRICWSEKWLGSQKRYNLILPSNFDWNIVYFALFYIIERIISCFKIYYACHLVLYYWKFEQKL